LQANTFVIMSVALRQMADARWPGMSDQGFGWYMDLTQPSVLLSSPIWASTCPYGVAGTLVPLALLVLYLTTVQQSPGRVLCCAVHRGVHLCDHTTAADLMCCCSPKCTAYGVHHLVLCDLVLCDTGSCFKRLGVRCTHVLDKL
jgi:hypothetical protein